jgi:hypothetical protein
VTVRHRFASLLLAAASVGLFGTAGAGTRNSDAPILPAPAAVSRPAQAPETAARIEPAAVSAGGNTSRERQHQLPRHALQILRPRRRLQNRVT